MTYPAEYLSRYDEELLDIAQEATYPPPPEICQFRSFAADLLCCPPPPAAVLRLLLADGQAVGSQEAASCGGVGVHSLCFFLQEMLSANCVILLPPHASSDSSSQRLCSQEEILVFSQKFDTLEASEA